MFSHVLDDLFHPLCYVMLRLTYGGLITSYLNSVAVFSLYARVYHQVIVSNGRFGGGRTAKPCATWEKSIKDVS